MNDEYILAAVILPIIITMFIWCVYTTSPNRRRARETKGWTHQKLTKHGDTWR